MIWFISDDIKANLKKAYFTKIVVQAENPFKLMKIGVTIDKN